MADKKLPSTGYIYMHCMLTFGQDWRLEALYAASVLMGWGVDLDLGQREDPTMALLHSYLRLTKVSH